MRVLPCLSALLALLPVLAPSAGAQDLLVTSRFGDEVLRFDAAGNFQSVFARRDLDNPVGLTFGPAGDLYVANAIDNRIVRYDGASGAALGVFVELANNCGVRQIQFGPDGHLYVACGSSNRIRRYDGQSGAPLGLFASDPSLNGPTSFTFGPDGDLFAVSVLGNRIVRFDGDSGAFVEIFSAGPHLAGPHDLSFGPDGRLWVSNAFSTRIVRLDPDSGALFDVFIDDPALANPLGMAFTPDGALLVANQSADEVLRYDALTGAPLGPFVVAGSGGLSGPLFLVLAPGVQTPEALAPVPGRAGESNLFAAQGFAPGSSAALFVSSQTGSHPVPQCPQSPLGLAAPRRLTLGVADEGGRLYVHTHLPAVLSGLTLELQAIELSTCRVGGVTHFTLP